MRKCGDIRPLWVKYHPPPPFPANNPGQIPDQTNNIIAAAQA